jgi:dihydroorotase
LNLPLGTLQVGKDADVTLLQANEKWVLTEERILSKSINTPFLGWEFKGKIMATVVGGKIQYADF